tara:strand:+ start:17454 stop:18854 length:1401 start_codon:yes stop_codon:yes gene_type:complete
MKNKTLLLSALLSCFAYNANAQNSYKNDRVYTGNQISNTVSVIDPSNNTFLGEIVLGKPYPNVLTPVYKGQVLVHGLRYSPEKKMLAVVSIGSNSVTFISTETNKVLKTIYVGRAAHEPTFTPDSKQVWTTIRGEAYVSVIDVDKMEEIKQIPVADGPGMIAFSNDGKLAYVGSSFTPVVEVVNTATYEIVKKIPVVSPFSPNIFGSPDGKLIALTHKDIGKVSVINTDNMTVVKVISTGPITNHVTFNYVGKKLMMYVTVGGENKVKVYDVADDYKLVNNITVGALPHGLWTSPDGKILYVGLEFGDEVQAINTETMTALPPVQIGQSPQALVYAEDAVSDANNKVGLKPLNDIKATQVIELKSANSKDKAIGTLAVRSIGLADLVEQKFTALQPNKSYTLALTKSIKAPYKADYEINTFTANEKGQYGGQSTGLVKKVSSTKANSDYKHVILIDQSNNKLVLID